MGDMFVFEKVKEEGGACLNAKVLRERCIEKSRERQKSRNLTNRAAMFARNSEGKNRRRPTGVQAFLVVKTELVQEG